MPLRGGLVTGGAGKRVRPKIAGTLQKGMFLGAYRRSIKPPTGRDLASPSTGWRRLWSLGHESASAKLAGSGWRPASRR